MTVTKMMNTMMMMILVVIIIIIMMILSSIIMFDQQTGRRVVTAVAVKSINSNPCPATSTTATSWSNLVELERYTASSSPSSLICTLVPANRTASFLWNAAATRIVEWTTIHALLLKSDSQQQQQQQLEQELVHMIRHDWRPQQMRRTIKGYPKSTVWKGLLNKIHQRLVYVTTSSAIDNDNDNHDGNNTTIEPPVVYILVLTPRLKNDTDVIVAAWQDTLQSILNQVFIQDDNDNDHDNFNKKLVFQVQVQSRSTAFTTPVYTESMRHGLFHNHPTTSSSSSRNSNSSNSNRGQPPDLILHAMGHADMMMGMMHHGDDNNDDEYDDDILQTVNFTDNLRHALQHFIRASLLGAPAALQEQCPPEQQYSLPIALPTALLFVDDYYNHRHKCYHHHHQSYAATNNNGEDSLFLKQVIYSRVVQQLADHYQLGYISHSASGIQRQEWINTATRSATTTSTTTTTTALGEPRQLDNSKANSNGGNIILTDQARHSIQILWTLLFSMLQYTIDECSSWEDPMSTALVPVEHLHRIENVIPPYLDGDLSLQNVSPRWKQQEDLQKQAAVTAAKNCPAMVAASDTTTAVVATDNKEQQGDASRASGDSSNTPHCSLALGPPMTAVEWRRKLTFVLPSSLKGRRLEQQDSSINTTTTFVSETMSEAVIAPGWKVLDNGILRATDYGAHLSLHVPLVGQQQQDEPHPQQQRMRAMLFVVHQTITVPSTSITASIASFAPTILEWSIQTENDNTPWTRQVNATTYHDDSNSRTTPVALPYIIEWTHATTTTKTTSVTRDIIKVDLQLLEQEGASSMTTPMVDIAAFFICRVLD